MQNFVASENAFAAADIDLQRFHRRLDIGCVLVSVGHLERVHDLNHGNTFAFLDENPKGEYLSELREGDWLRVWAPGRERILASGKLTRGSASKDGPPRLGTLSLSKLSSWFERRFPAEYAPAS